MKYDGIDACRNCFFGRHTETPDGGEVNRCWAPEVTGSMRELPACQDARSKSGPCGPEARYLVLWGDHDARRLAGTARSVQR